MNLFAARVQSNDFIAIPIMYSMNGKDSLRDAIMYNIYPDGMSFRSECPVPMEKHLYIRMKDLTPETFISGAFQACVARVSSCEKVVDDNTEIYDVAVKFLTNGLIIIGGSAREYQCDLCSETDHSEEMYITQDSLYLCHDCFKRWGELVDGEIRESIERFMVGNVL